MKVLVGTFNKEKALVLVGAFSVIVKTGTGDCCVCDAMKCEQLASDLSHLLHSPTGAGHRSRAIFTRYLQTQIYHFRD